MVESLVDKAVHSFSGGVSQGHAKIVVERLQVSGLKALKNHLIPCDVRLKQIELFARCAAILDFKVINDVEAFGRSPVLRSIVTPSIIIFEINTGPSLKGQINPVVAGPVARP